MMLQFNLSDEEVRKNIDFFQSTNEKYKIFSPELLDFLGSELYLAPASTHLNLHNCFPGGLIDHMIRVAKNVNNINKLLSPDLKQELESIIKVSFLSQIGKVKLYTPSDSKWHKENQGKYYDYNGDLIAMSLGERSAYYCLNNNVKLKENEYQAIINYSKGLIDDNQARYYSDVLTVLLRQGIELSILEEKNRWKKIQ